MTESEALALVKKLRAQFSHAYLTDLIRRAGHESEYVETPKGPAPKPCEKSTDDFVYELSTPQLAET